MFHPAKPPETLNPDAVVEYFRTVDRVYRRAEATPEVRERDFDVGGYTVRVRALGGLLFSRMTDALAHLAAERASSAELTIHAWDSASTGTPSPPSPVAWYNRHRHLEAVPLDGARIDARAELRAFTTERIRSRFHGLPGMLELLDTRQDHALFWIDDAGSLPYYETSAPFSKILSWWMSERDRLFLHAGAVGTAAGGVLLIGEGGLGKSTAALACLGSGLGYAGDDYCLVATAREPRVYSLYSSAKLKGRADLARFPRLAPLVRNAERLEHEKALMFLHPWDPHGLIASFPLRALLIPRVTGAAQARLIPTSPSVALRAMAPSTIRQLPGIGRRAWGKMTRLVKQVPSYVLEVGPAMGTIPSAIERLLAER